VPSKLPHSITLAKVAGLTALWAIPLFAVLALSTNWASAFKLSYGTYFRILWFIGPMLIFALLFGAYRASRFIPPKPTETPELHWYQDCILLALLVFWALGPPSYFFVEYYAFDQGFIEWDKPAKCAGELSRQCLADLKVYSDLASKFWAGAGAMFVALTALAKNAT
jgi:hypothetical protein